MTIFEEIAIFAGFKKVTDTEPYGLSYWIKHLKGEELSFDTAYEVCKSFTKTDETILNFCETEIHKRFEGMGKRALKNMTKQNSDREKYSLHADVLVYGLQPIIDIGFTFPKNEPAKNIYFFYCT